MKKFWIAAIVAVTGLSLGVLAQNARVDGRWEVKTEMSVPGMPKPMAPTTATTCITKEEAADPQKQVPPGSSSDCKVSDYKTVGNKVTYSVTCTTPQPMTMAAEMIYGQDTYTGTMTMQMARGGQPMTMTMKYTGKRLGDCVK